MAASADANNNLLASASSASTSSSITHSTGLRTVAGRSPPISFDIFSPSGPAALTPRPLFLLVHGALVGRKEDMHGHARRIAADAGCVALTPSLGSMAGGPQQQLDAVAAVADLVGWACALTAPLIDGGRVFLVGHSGGGAVALEAAIELAKTGSPVSAVVLLDAVPWPRTVAAAARDFFVDLTLLISLRAEPGMWNGGGSVTQILRSPRVAAGSGATVFDLVVRGSGHRDFIGGSAGGDALSTCFFFCLGLIGPRACADAVADLIVAIAQGAADVDPNLPQLSSLARFCACADELESCGAARRGGGGVL